METKRIKILVSERTTNDGRKFNTFKTPSQKKNGVLIDVKFRKEVQNVPKESSFITVAVDDMNLSTRGEYPVLWIKAIADVEPIAAVFNAEQNAAIINEWF